jgi:hypothetical protein
MNTLDAKAPRVAIVDAKACSEIVIKFSSCSTALSGM